MIEKLIIKKTEDTPAVILNPEKNIFQIVGTSWPENAKNFYAPILEWFEKYFEEGANPVTTVDFMLEYFNTSSSKQIARLLNLLKEKSQYYKIIIRWHYNKDDLDINKEGARFAQIVGIPIEFVSH